MDYLTKLIQKTIHSSKFSYHPKCKKIGFVQLGFADDLMIFCKADSASVSTINQILMHFSEVSGLQVNRAKSSMFFGGINDNFKSDLLSKYHGVF